MSRQTEVRQPGRSWLSLLAWNTRDILILAAISVVFGILLGALLYPYMLSVVLGPIVAWAWIGLYILPGFFIAYALRRPGAAFLIALLYCFVTLPISPYGPSIMITGILYACSGEISVALGTRYRHFGLPWMALTGFLGGFVMLIIYAIFYPSSFQLALPVLIGVIAITVVSSTLSGILARYLGDAAARTGVLAGTIRREQDEI
jgi:ABC-type thiamin/hydroxymethylpyrimidine transport system permease subunit